jgi:hypothetical protein
MPGMSEEKVVYGDSKNNIHMLLCDHRELPPRDLISTQDHCDYILLHREHQEWITQVGALLPAACLLPPAAFCQPPAATLPAACRLPPVACCLLVPPLRREAGSESQFVLLPQGGAGSRDGHLCGAACFPPCQLPAPGCRLPSKGSGGSCQSASSSL